MKIAVAGAGGFIGGHLVNSLVEDGHTVICVDKKPFKQWYQVNKNSVYYKKDISIASNAVKICNEVDQVYMLAADMGGMGFIENNKLACMLSVLSSTHMLKAAQEAGIGRFFYSSSACVYAADKQTDTNITALKESDAYPAMAEDGYGWEKLFTERMCKHYAEETDMVTRVARFHNVYGPDGTFEGGREKAPAALCRKVIHAKLSGELGIDIWGDGEQTRSFMYVDDCVKGTKAIMDSDIDYPINLGSSELVSINGLLSIIEGIAGVKLERSYDLTAPQGVRGRNSDNTLIQKELNWEPSITLLEGLEKTYAWIYDQMAKRYK